MSRSARLLPAATAGLAMVATLLVVAPPGEASRTVSEAYTVPANGKARADRARLRPRPRDVPVRRPGCCPEGADLPADPGLLLPGHDARERHRVDAGADLGRHRQRRTRRTRERAERAPGRRHGVHPARRPPASRPGGCGSPGPQRFSTTTTARWHTYLPGGKALSGDAEFFRAGKLTLRVDGTTRAYRGALRLASNDTVNVLGLDDYVKGVVPREMPTSWQPAAVRAQAVAARTYAVFDRNAHPSRATTTPATPRRARSTAASATRTRAATRPSTRPR